MADATSARIKKTATGTWDVFLGGVKVEGGFFFKDSAIDAALAWSRDACRAQMAKDWAPFEAVDAMRKELDQKEG